MRSTQIFDILAAGLARTGGATFVVVLSLSGSLHAEELHAEELHAEELHAEELHAVTTTPPTAAPASTLTAPPSQADANAESPDVGVSRGRILVLSPAIIDEMKRSTWRPGCPVALEDLRLIQTPYLKMTGETETGEIVVHAVIADATLAAFEELYAAGFPIERMERIERYEGSDDASMRANNTSAFNCRKVTGGRGYSKHAYGVALDINPLLNPYVKRRKSGVVVEPETGRPYLKRDPLVPGLIIKGDVVHRAFTSRGFTWGGTWRSVQDYQHFETARPAKPKKR